jgi:tetratricopeptide (TPR) repeat protein
MSLPTAPFFTITTAHRAALPSRRKASGLRLLIALLLLVSPAVSAPGASAASADTAAACLDLLATGQSALGRGEVKLADKCFVEALAEAEKLGKEDKHVAMALNDLALTTATNPDKTIAKKDKLSKAIAYQKRSIAIEEKVYGLESENVAFDLHNLGVWYGLNQQLKEGEAALRRAAKIREKLFGKNSDRLGVTLGSLASNLRSQKRFAEATTLLQRAADIYKETDKATAAGKLAPHALERSRVLNELADIYQDQGNFQQGLVILAEVLNLREKIFGLDSLLVAETLHNMSACQIKLGRDAEALVMLKRALTIVKKGRDPEITAAVSSTYKTAELNLAKKTGAAKATRSGSGGR